MLCRKTQPEVDKPLLLLGTDNREALQHFPAFVRRSSVGIHVIGVHHENTFPRKRQQRTFDSALSGFNLA